MTENQATEQSVAEAMQVPESAAGLDVQLAQELIEKARQSGVSLVGPVELAVPRDRNGSFIPQIVPKHARRVGGFGEAIISL